MPRRPRRPLGVRILALLDECAKVGVVLVSPTRLQRVTKNLHWLELEIEGLLHRKEIERVFDSMGARFRITDAGRDYLRRQLAANYPSYQVTPGEACSEDVER